MPSKKNKGRAKDIRTVKAIKALMDNPTIQAAYEATHPNSSKHSASKNAKNMLTPEVVDGFRKAMGVETFAVASKAVLEKILFTVVARWYSGAESTRDMLAAVKTLTPIVPEWSDKITVTQEDSEEAILKQLKELGIDPQAIRGN